MLHNIFVETMTFFPGFFDEKLEMYTVTDQINASVLNRSIKKIKKFQPQTSEQ